jgi:peptide/nickel transport system substrate-binding protein
MTRTPLRLRDRAVRWLPVACLGITLGGCRDVQQQQPVAGPNDVGGTMVVATPSEPGTLLPPLVVLINDRQLTDLLFDRLAEIGDELNTVGDKGFKPVLAERWDWAADSMTIAFHLNPKARWHDGVPVRASDVRYSFNLMRDPALGSSAASLITNIDSIAVRDSLTVVAYFKRHTPEQFYDLVYQVSIVPEHILGNTPPAQLKTAEVARRGIGSGRFRLAHWEAGKRVEIVADTANYRGRPKLDRVVFTLSPDFNSAVGRFFSGDADFFEQLRSEHLPRIATDTARRAQRFPGLQYVSLLFNLVDPKQPSAPHPIFGDRALRRALTMAVDRRAMLRNVFDTLGVLLYGPFPRAMTVADTTLPQLPYDTLKSRALLDSIGWVAGPDGIRSKNGQRLAFAISVPSSSAARSQYAVLLQDAFRRIGAAVTVDRTDFATFAAKQSNHAFDTEMNSYNMDPSPSGFKQTWTTAGIGNGGANFTSYSNPAVDAYIDSASTTFDPARTRAYTRRAFEQIIEDAPGIWLYEPLSIAGIHKRIRTTGVRADEYWAGMADWWIPAAERSARDRIGLAPTP